jgi:hypothetical protein
MPSGLSYLGGWSGRSGPTSALLSNRIQRLGWSGIRRRGHAWPLIGAEVAYLLSPATIRATDPIGSFRSFVRLSDLRNLVEPSIERVSNRPNYGLHDKSGFKGLAKRQADSSSGNARRDMRYGKANDHEYNRKSGVVQHICGRKRSGTYAGYN